MANAWFDKGLEAFATGLVNWSTSNIKATLVDHADDTPNVSTDDFYNDIASAARVATSGNFAGKSATNGFLDANDLTFTSVTGDPAESLIVWGDTGTESTSPLLVYFDTATGLPVTPDGGNITVTWDNGTNKIARL